MRYDTVLIGSGFAPVGYAIARGSTLIVEERELLDTHFSLPLRTFSHTAYAPVTPLGRELREILGELMILSEGQMNTPALEIALATLALRHGTHPRLKCRAVEVKEHTVRIFTNRGFETVEAERVIDTRVSYGGAPAVSLLYEGDGTDGEREAIVRAFPGAVTEPAFYPRRYAAHLPCDPKREPNALRAELLRQWEGAVGRRILSVSPITGVHGLTAEDAHALCDSLYRNPIEALERGVAFAEEVRG